MIAAAGIVTSQAVAMVAPSPQLTAERFLVTPTPITHPVITCVVLTGRPIRVAPCMTLAAMRFAVKGVADASLMLLQPRLRLMPPPPAYVPTAVASADRATAQM